MESLVATAPTHSNTKRKIVVYNKQKMSFITPNDMCEWRIKTIFSKEPVTIDWLTTFQPGKTFWDVGANIGLYSIFATAVSQVITYSFEPESQNYQILNTNIFNNNLHFRIKAYPLALSNQKTIGELALSKIEGGHSGHDIRPTSVQYLKYTQGCMTTTGDSLIRMGVKVPTYLKIDVDGVEHLIVEGFAKNIDQIQNVLIEINEKDKRHTDLISYMVSKGFYYDQEQVDKTKRPPDSPQYFQSFREYIFKRHA